MYAAAFNAYRPAMRLIGRYAPSSHGRSVQLRTITVRCSECSGHGIAAEGCVCRQCDGRGEHKTTAE